jgi:hypothetical protein
MKPSLSVVAHVKVLTAKVINHTALSINVRPLLFRPPPAYPLWLIVLLLAFVGSANGTAILLVWTPKEIVVAADSLSSDADGKDTGSVCKIGKFGDAYFAISGYAKNDRTGYNAFAILEVASGQSGGLTDKITAFESSAKAMYEKALSELRKTNYDGFRRVVEAPLAVSFFGVERGLLVLHNREFVINPPADNQVSATIVRRNCPGIDCPDEEATLIVTGDPEIQLKFARENPHFWLGSLVNATRKFVQMHIDAKVPGVGPPIDIFRITENGAEWICQKPDCDKENKKGVPCKGNEPLPGKGIKP